MSDYPPTEPLNEIRSDLVSVDTIKVRFALDRRELRKAWQRIGSPVADDPVELVLSDTKLTFIVVTKYIRTRAVLALVDPAGLPIDRALRINVQGKLFDRLLCNAQLHSFDTEKGLSDILYFETPEEFVLDNAKHASPQLGYLWIRDRGLEVTWPCFAEYTEPLEVDAVPEAAMPIEPRVLGEAIGRVSRLMHSARKDGQPGLLSINGRLVQAESDLGVCRMDAEVNPNVDIRLEPEAVGPLSKILLAYGGGGYGWTSDQGQSFQCGRDYCLVDRCGRQPFDSHRLDNETPLAALRFPPDLLYGRLPGLLAQASPELIEVDLSLSGSAAPTLRFVIPVEDGEASLTVQGSWIDGALTKTNPYRRFIIIDALEAILRHRPRLETTDLILRERSIQFQEISDGIEFNAFIACRSPKK